MLESALASADRLKKETGMDTEIIVADNGSTDNTAGIAREMGAKVVYEPHRQIAAARNRGARETMGEILVFSDADNIFEASLLLSIYNRMKTGLYVGGGVKVKMEKGSALGRVVQAVFNTVSLLIGYSGGVLYTDRNRFFKLGGFNESFYTNEDGLLIREMAREKKRTGLRYSTVRDSYVITSNRKFRSMKFMDLLRQSFELATGRRDPKLRDDCSIWYDRGS